MWRSTSSFLIILLLLVVALKAQRAQEWPVYGGDPGGMKYALLTQINRENVGTLEHAWTWKSGEKPLPDKGTTPGRFEATPIMIGDVLYLSTPYNRVMALDANDGRELWSYDPRAYEWGPGPMGVPFGKHRGVAIWTEQPLRGPERGAGTPARDAPGGVQGSPPSNQSRIFINTRWRLIALDAKTGQPIPSFGREGEVDLTKDLAWEVKDKTHYMNTSPPVVYKDLVILGNAVSDSLGYPQSPPGDIQAFDVRTGKRVWIFHTIPQKGEFGYETWENGSAETSGHANAWVPMVLDEERGLLYAPVSTPANDYYGGQRKGDNLFSNSLVCLDANTGKRVWHFQTVHHGLWDYDGVMMPTLATIRVDGKPLDIVAAPAKTGFIYVFDRVTGKPVWPIEERPVPQSDVPGEQTSPTQPFPTKPPPFTTQGFTVDDVVDFTPALRAQALKLLKPHRFGPIFTPPSLEGTLFMPGNSGGGNWGGGSFDPDTGIFYVRGKNWLRLITLEKAAPDAGGVTPGTYPGVAEGDYWWRFPATPMVANGIPVHKPPYGTVTAIDLNKGEILWQVAVGDTPIVRSHPLLKGLNLPPVGGVGHSSPIVTLGGLVFVCGIADRKLHALDKQTGESLWQGALGIAVDATPMTYQTQSGRQFVVVAAGAGPDTALMAFALPSADRR